MAATFAILRDGEDFWGRQHLGAYQVTLDSSYPTGGYSLGPILLETVRGVEWWGSNTAGLGFIPSFNPTTKKIQILVGAAAGSALQEATGGTNLSTVVITLCFLGN